MFHGEVMREYPEDKPYPSCLLYGDTFGGDPGHSVWAYKEKSGFAVNHNSVQAGSSTLGTGLEDEEKMKMALDSDFSKAFDVCPVCGGELIEKRVEKLLRGGSDTARLEVEAFVCQRCGEKLYPEKTVRRFERVRNKLSRKDTEDLTLIGSSYEAPGE